MKQAGRAGPVEEAHLALPVVNGHGSPIPIETKRGAAMAGIGGGRDRAEGHRRERDGVDLAGEA